MVSPVSIENLSADEKRRLLAEMMQKKKQAALPRQHPLSRAQQGLWVLDQMHPNRCDYNILNAYRLQGALQFDALQRALAAIIERHEALRTAFSAKDGKGVAVIGPTVPFSLRSIDLSATPEADRLNEAQRVTTAEVQKPFDLSKGYLFRFLLLKLGATDHILLFVLHHIISDTLSYITINKELEALYAAFLDSKPSPLKPLTMQYRDYVAREQAEPPTRLSEDTAWWKDRLQGLEVTELNGDFPRPPELTYNGAVVRLSMPGALSDQIRASSREAGVSSFVSFCAAFLALLHRYTGREDINCGTPMANRDSLELQAMVGYFVNNVIVRTDFSDFPSFRVLQRRVHEIMKGAFTHPKLPFERLVDALAPERDPSRNPLCQIAFQAIREPELKLRDLQVAPVFALDYGLVRTDVEFYLIEAPGKLECILVYNRDLFRADSMQAFAAHYQMILEGVLAEPDVAVKHLELCTDSERNALTQWNATDTPFPYNTCIHHLFEAVAVNHPHLPAVLYEGDELSYEALNQRANQLAHALREKGLQPDEMVGLCYDRQADMVVAMLAILKAGGAYVAMDTHYPLERLVLIHEDAEPRLIVSHSSGLATLSQLSLGNTQVICPDRDADALQQLPATNPVSRTGPDNLVYAIYTSGSTGKPKGVVNVHRGLCNLVGFQREQFLIEPGKRVGQFFTINFDASVWEISMCIYNGATLCLAPREQWAPGPALVKALRDFRVNILTLSPSVLATLEDHDFPHLETLIVAGEACNRDLVVHWGPKLRFFNAYGPSETTVCATMIRCEQPEKSSPPIGRAINNFKAYVVDRGFRALPPGIDGELVVDGAGLARGYFKKPALTATRYLPNPFSEEPGARLYRTGDLCRFRRDGQIMFVGRIDFQVKLRGFRIELGEIEAVLDDHAGVRDCLVLVHKKPGGPERLVAYWSSTSRGRGPTASVLRAHVAERLPEYMVPATFIQLDAFPLTPSGKIDRRALPEPDAGKGPVHQSEPPRGDTQTRLAEIWHELLKLDQVCLDDNFFEIGGNSLLIVQAHKRVVEAFECDLPMVELYRLSTIRSLAAHLDGEDANDLDPVVPASRPTGQRDIAVIGMVGRFPGADSVDALWALLRDGKQVMRDLADEELAAAGVPQSLIDHPDYVKKAALLEEPYHFDAAFFGMNPREAESVDPQQRLFLEASWSLLEQAGYDPFSYKGKIGVFAGMGASFYMIELLSNPEALAAIGPYAALVNNDKDFLATRVAYKLNLRGPAFTVQSACSTSLVALHQARKSLLEGEADMALAGGVTVRDLAPRGYLYQKNMILSPDGACRPFDSQARGTFGSNGLAAVLLKRLDDALADGDTIHAVVKGSAINNDGTLKASFSAPSIDGQAEVISTALAESGVPAETIGYIEAHGTGTDMGDPIEVAALGKAFGRFTKERGFAHLGAVKANVGHLDTAAGVTGLIKVILAMKHRQKPPLLHFNEANDKLDFAASPAVPNGELIDWESDGPRRAGVSSFGIGGTNAHVIVEEAPVVEAGDSGLPYQLLVLSARSNKALEAGAAQLASFLSENEVNLADAAYTLQVGRRGFELRHTAVISDRDSAIASLASVAPSTVPGTAKVGFMFSGQGAQYAGMGHHLYQHVVSFREDVDRCCELLLPILGEDLRSVLFPSEEMREAATEALNQTRLAQPALFTMSFCLAKLWRSWGIEPHVMIGHSIGEYAAACLAGVFELEDALRLVAERGRLMQSLPKGSMLSVAKGEEELAPFLDDSVSLAAVNAPGRVVVAGADDAISALQGRLKVAGISSSLLHTSHAFHSAMMDPILPEFTELVASMSPKASERPFISNLSGTWITAEEACDPGYWARHLRGTVRFADGVDQLVSSHEHLILLEVGPGNTLATLAGKAAARNKSLPVLSSLPHPRQKMDDLALVLASLGSLWRHGVAVDWQALHRGSSRRRIPLPTYAFQRQPFKLGGQFKVLDGSASREDSSVLPDDTPSKPSQPSTSSFHARPDLVSAYVAPVDDLQRQITTLWQHLMRIDRIGIEDPFFDLGGDSLLATQFLAQLRANPLQIDGRERHVDLSLEDLFDHPTPALLVSLIKERAAGDDVAVPPPITPAVRDQNLPLSFAQNRLWLMDRLNPDSPFYNLVTEVRFHGELHPAIFERCLQEMVARHEVLRTRVEVIDGDPYQFVMPEQKLDFTLDDFSDQDDPTAALEKARAEETGHIFSLLSGPLIKARLIKTAPTTFHFICTLHHWIADGWSGEVISQEIRTNYPAFLAGDASPLEPLAIQYADYAVWQRNWLQGDVMERFSNWWKRALGGAAHDLSLPSDKVRPERMSYRGASIRHRFDGELSGRLKAFARARNTTLFMVLQAGFFALMRYRTGRDDMLIGTDVANRNHPGCEPLIGFFVNQLALRVTAGSEMSFEDLLARVREVTLGAYAHQDMPFDKLVEALNPKRDPAYSPIFQTKFTFLNMTGGADAFAGIEMEVVEVERATAQLDLIMNLYESPEGLVSFCEFSTDLYTSELIERFHQQLENVWQKMLDDPSLSLDALNKSLEREEKEARIAKQKQRGLSGLRKLGGSRRRGIKPKGE